MNKWSILGIAETKDKEIIKQAYRKQLVGVNPEDDPEGFMELRNAYEDALKDADTEEDESKKDEFFVELKNLYDDFHRRIRVDEWQKIFSRDEFVSLDTSEMYMHKVLEFLMNYNYIPQEVFKYIVDTFDLNSIKNELVEIFPENFITFVFNNAMYGDSISYELFDEVNEHIDEYIKTFYKLEDAMNQRIVEEEKKYIDKLESFEIYHPYVEMKKLIHGLHVINSKVNSNEERAEKYKDKLNELLVEAKKIVNKYPEEINLLVSCCNIALVSKDTEGAKQLCTKALEIDPNNYSAKGVMGDIYYEMGEYEKSRDTFMDLLAINRYDQGSSYGLRKANSALIEQYNKELEENDSQETKLKLGWCYYRNGLFNQGIQLFASFEPSDENKKEYYNLLGRYYFYTNQYDIALEMFFKWKNEYGDNPTFDSENKKDKERYGYLHFFISECYLKLNNLDEARKNIEIAISHEHDLNSASYETLCEIEYQSGNYDRCISVCESIIEKRENFDSYMYMAKCYDKLGEYSRAINACENAIINYPYFIDPYVLKLEIYSDFKQYEDMDAVIHQIEGNNLKIEESDRISFYKAKVLAHDKDYEGSNAILERIVANKETENTDMDDYYKVYIGLAVNYDNLGESETALKYFICALEEDPGNLAIMDRIGELYHEMRRYEESLKYYDMIIDANDDDYHKSSLLGKAAVLSCLGRFEEAQGIYEKCEQKYGFNDYYIIDHAELLVRMDNLPACVNILEKGIAEGDDVHFVRSCMGNLCCFYGNEGYIDDAYRMFKRVNEKIPDEYEIYRSMALVYFDHKMYDKAKALFERLVELDTERNTFAYGPYLIAIGRTDDVFKPEYQKYIDIAKEQLEKYSDNYRPYICIKKAEIYHGLKQYDKALEILDIAIENKGVSNCFDGNYDAWYEKGSIYEDVGEYEKALQCYRQALEIFGHEKLFEEAVKRCEGYTK